MKRIISFISIFVLFINLFAFPIPVKADGLPVPGYTELKEMQQDVENGDNRTLQDIWKVGQPIGQAIGVIMNPIQTIEFIRDLVDPVAQTLPDYPSNGSDTDKANYLSEYLINNTNFNDNNKTYTLNQNAKNLVNGVVNNYINRSGVYYVYSFDLLNHINIFSDGDMFSALRRFVNDHQDNYICVFGYKSGYRIALYPNTSNTACIFAQNLYTDIDFNHVYKMSDWTVYNPSEIYYYNSSSKEFVQGGNASLFSGILCGNKSGMVNSQILQTNSVGGFSYVTLNRTGSLRCYSDINGLKQGSQGVQPYYYNNTVYNNYKNSTGDYTVTTDNSNHATYGDVNTYIDNSTTENGNPPTSTDINIYIEQVPAPTPTPTPIPTPTITPDNPSGGGDNNGGSVSGNTANGGNASASAAANNSGVNVTVNNNHNINLNVPGLSGNGIGSGTVSGNGNGSGGIFDWISDIGGVIGEFIKNVGSLIADVIKGITETITTILADIPNIISVLVEFVYGGLPDELKAIVTLGITTVIFVGVIKMMRK